MSLELKLEALTNAVLANTAELAKIVAGGAGSGAPATTADGEKTPRTRRSREPAEDKASEAKSVSLDEVKAATNKFLDVADEEYEARVKAVYDPIFTKAKVEKLGELPAEFYGAVMDGIAGYTPTSSRRAI